MNISASLSILLGDIICALFNLRSHIIKRLITSLWTHVCVCSRVAGCGNCQRTVVFPAVSTNRILDTRQAAVQSLRQPLQLRTFCKILSNYSCLCFVKYSGYYKRYWG